MSQFGYAEEPGENKASADIYAVIPPLVIPPGIQHHTECVLLRVISENGHCCLVLCLVIYTKTTHSNKWNSNRKEMRLIFKKKKQNGASAAQFFITECERG